MYRKRNLGKYVNSKIYKALNKTIEQKYLDTFVDGTTGIVFGTALIVKVSAPTQGTSDIQRVGDRIKAMALNFKYNCVAADTVNRMRVSVIRWQEDDGSTLPSNSQIYQNITSNIQSFFNYDNISSGRFKVLYDKVEDIELTNGNAQMYRHKYIKLKGTKIGFTGSTSGRGHLYVIVNSDSGLTPHPSFDGLCRFTYKDA